MPALSSEDFQPWQMDKLYVSETYEECIASIVGDWAQRGTHSVQVYIRHVVLYCRADTPTHNSVWA